MTINETLSHIVTENYQAAPIFEKYGLDFCCKGKRSLADACVEKGLDANTLINELEAAAANPKADTDFSSYSLSELAGYIVRVHHTYVKVNGPQALHYVARVASRHGDRYPHMSDVYRLFAQLLEELQLHMQKEEAILFPRIKALELQGAANIDTNFLGAPIGVMEAEHDEAGALLARISELTSRYTPPAGACTTHTLALASLQAFEADLHRHVHLENNILFPKALAVAGLLH